MNFKVGDEVEIPDAAKRKFAGCEMRQNPRHVGKTGKIIALTKIGGVDSPLIRLNDANQTLIGGWECWWRPLKSQDRSSQ